MRESDHFGHLRDSAGFAWPGLLFCSRGAKAGRRNPVRRPAGPGFPPSPLAAAKRSRREETKSQMPIPVLTIAQTREWEEASWADGCVPKNVVARVGRLIAEQLLQHSAPKQKILVLAGRGLNGADAKATIQHILARNPTLLEVEDPEESLPQLHENLAARPDLILDGLFGIGLNRPLSEAWKRFINVVNESGIPIIALDVPSGLNADTGVPEGAAINATWTITLGSPKAGLLEHPASPFVGKLEVLPDIGLSAMPEFGANLLWMESADFRGFPRQRPIHSHKGNFGHAVLVAGSPGYHGAAVLASRGAQRAQPGLITIITQEWLYFPVAAQTQAAMVRAWKPNEPLPAKTTALLYGPGLGVPDKPDQIKQEIQKNWLKLPQAVVVDASALDWLPVGSESGPGTRVITPHPGEAARLLGVPVEDVESNRAKALRDLSERHGGCWVVLKGSHTLVGRATGPIFVNSSGNALLGQGGSGDLLAGFITGLLAQPTLNEDPGKALAFAVWAHGIAADTLSATRPNWIIEDLAAQLGLRPAA